MRKFILNDLSARQCDGMVGTCGIFCHIDIEVNRFQKKLIRKKVSEKILKSEILPSGCLPGTKSTK